LPHSPSNPGWGNPPWTIDFNARHKALPDHVDFAVVGGGFTGLSAASFLRRLAPHKTTAVFETDRVGAGSSGHTGGMTLAESAAGNLPGLGDVLKGFREIQRELHLDCELLLPGAWELSRTSIQRRSPISWKDSGTLGVARKISGGTVDPGKLVSGLARAAQRLGADIFENTRVEKISFENPLQLEVTGKRITATRVLIATNAESLELSDLSSSGEPKFTLALATAPLTNKQLKDIGLSSHHPFYTQDLPYLWGRPLHGSQVIFGSGLVQLNHWSELQTLNISTEEAAALMRLLESRVRSLHPALENVAFTNRWGGPIFIADEWIPIFRHHPKSKNVIVLGGYSGHGVALSVYLGRWAAKAMLGKRKLPSWNKPATKKSAGRTPSGVKR
jgi:glycine/D-amino acid oxidase-like deaminating enzyme